MTHTVFIDLDSHVATASASGTAAPNVPLKHLTKQTLAFAFHSGGTVQAVTGWDSGRVIVKAAPTSDVLLLDTTLAVTGSTTSTRYSAEWASADCDSAAMRTLIGASTEPLDVWAEIQWTDADGTYAVAFPIQIVPTFNLPEDDPPDPVADASWAWLKARLAAGANITFTDNDTTQVRTIASSGGGGGGGGSTDWGDIGGTLSDQTDLQTALNNKQPLAAALTTLSSATAAGLALMDDADAAAQRTTLGLGNVNNTSDADKPVSTATQTALNLKQNTISGGALGSLFMNGGLGWTVVSKSTAIVNLFGALPSPVNQSYAIGYDGTNINWTAITDLLKSIGTQAQGGVLVRGASTWEFLPVGTSGQFLKSNGAGANPEWAAPAGGDALTTNPLSQFAATTSSQLAGVISDETGTGSLVFANSPTLVTPALGTPASGVLTNCTGLSLASGVTDTLPLANGGTGQTSAQAAIDALLAASGALAQGDIFYYDGTNVVRLAAGTNGYVLQTQGAGADPIWAAPVAASGGDALTTNPLSQFASTTSDQLAGVISDETGTGALVFANSPTLVTPALGTPASGTLTNCTGLPVAGLASFVGLPVEYSVALGDETTAATGSTTVPKITWRSPCALANVTVRFECVTAPTGSVAILDIHEAGTSIFEGGSGVKPQIAISATTSVGGAVPGVVHDTSIADNAVLEFFIDQVGSTIAGAGYKATIKATRA